MSTATVLRADAGHLPLPDASVDLIVTSPPYFALRSYTDGGEHYAGQIGAEPTPREYIAALIDCTREWMRVLRPGGSLFVNLGDKYSGAQAQNVAGANRAGDSGRTWRQTDPRRTGIPNKSLMFLPERYRIAAVDELGLIARAVIVWSKPNGLPESVTDRVRRSHEDWVHLTKLPRYFSAVDEIREQHAERQKGLAASFKRPSPSRDNGMHRTERRDDDGYNPLGKLPGSVWEIPDSVWDNGNGDLVRLVLAAVSAGELSIKEGWRLLCPGKTSSGRGSRSAATAAGTGSASSTAKATAGTGEPMSATAERTDSPTSLSRDPSPTASPSTTSAAAGPASTPTTSSQSPSPSTSSVGQGPSLSASTGTPSLPRTPTFDPADTASAGLACDCGCANTDDASELPDSTVWTIATEPLKVPDHISHAVCCGGRKRTGCKDGVDHFAAFPTEWPRRIILGWSPSGICTECGEGRRPVASSIVEKPPIPQRRGAEAAIHRGVSATSALRMTGGDKAARESLLKQITGEACDCPDTSAPTRPAVVLDPFGGTGTTALVAKALGRHGISVDMSADYCRLARWRTTDPGQLAKAMRVTAPVKQLDGQADLFGEWVS